MNFHSGRHVLSPEGVIFALKHEVMKSSHEHSTYARFCISVVKWAIISFIVLILYVVICYVAENRRARMEEHRPEKNDLEEFTNFDPAKDILDIKSIDYENKVIHYYQYRNDPHDWTPAPAKPDVPPQRTTIIIDGKETILEASPEEIISTLMDQVDYNELLDFYGDPELR